jgi:hypothetical protein
VQYILNAEVRLVFAILLILVRGVDGGQVRRRRCIYNVNNAAGHLLRGVADNIYIDQTQKPSSIVAEIYAGRGRGV